VNPPDGGQAAALVTWIDRLRNAGVCADRHDSPDLVGQLNQVVSRPVDTVICTVLDADSNCRLNATLAARHAQVLAGGVALLLRITGAPRGVIAMEAGAGQSWAAPVRQAAAAQGLHVLELNNDYPQADPTLMLYTLTRRRLRPGNLPTTQGVLLLDAAAALAVGRASQGASALRTPLAVHDHTRRQAHLLSVMVGTPLAHVLEQLGIDAAQVTVRGGDLPRDVRLSPQAVGGGAELTIHVTWPEADASPEPCIRCAWCVEACPTLVQPAAVLEAAQRYERAGAERAGAERAGIGACIECGL
jgi:electron transport complex protein RnfC